MVRSLADLVIVLHEHRPERVVDGVVGIAVALRVALDVGDVVQVSWSFRRPQSACVQVL